MQVKMASSNSILLAFVVLVLCLSHGSWSGSARPVVSDDFMLSQSKRELSEEYNQVASEPVRPGGMLDLSPVQESDNEHEQPLEDVVVSASDVDTGLIDGAACRGRYIPNCHPNNCHSSGIPYPAPTCTPSSTCPPLGIANTPCPGQVFPPQPSPACQQPTCVPNTTPCYQPAPSQGCQPSSTPCQSGSNYPGCVNPGCAAYPPQSGSGYPPQCVNYGCAYPPQSGSDYPPQCGNSGCFYPPQPNPGCFTPDCQPTNQPPSCAFPGCQSNYPPQLGGNYPQQPDFFYPPQNEASPGTGPRIDEQNSLEQESNGSLQPNEEVEIMPADEVEEGETVSNQDLSQVMAPSTI